MTDDLLTNPNYSVVQSKLRELESALNYDGNWDAKHDAKIRDLREELVFSLRKLDEADTDPDPPEEIPRDPHAEAVDELTAENIAKADAETLLAAVRKSEAEALKAGGLDAGPVALQRALRHADRDERAPEHLIKPALRELDRQQRSARRLERETDAERARAIDAGDRDRARDARLLNDEANKAATQTERRRAKLAGALHAEPHANWTGDVKDREWLLPCWIAVGRVHLLTGAGGRGKSRLSLQLAAALASEDAELPVPWQEKDKRTHEKNADALSPNIRRHCRPLPRAA